MLVKSTELRFWKSRILARRNEMKCPKEVEVETASSNKSERPASHRRQWESLMSSSTSWPPCPFQSTGGIDSPSRFRANRRRNPGFKEQSAKTRDMEGTPKKHRVAHIVADVTRVTARNTTQPPKPSHTNAIKPQPPSSPDQNNHESIGEKATRRNLVMTLRG